MRTAVAVLAAAIVAAWASAAGAHSYSVAYPRAAIDADRTGALAEVKIPLADLGEALGLGRDVVASPDAVTREAERLIAFATERVELAGDGRRCEPRDPAVSVEGELARVAWRCGWEAPIERFTLDYDLFFDIDPNHTGMLEARWLDARVATPLTADASLFSWELGAAPPSGLGGFLLSGVEHIFFGADHIAFLIGLLLVARRLRSAFAIVTSFTVAHSITLIAAALGWFELSSRLVESLIAASIVFVCVENLARPDPPHRWALTFAFGLVHGVGFASMLRPLLPESGVVVPLLAFNAGVELGQLVIVAVAFPLLHVAVTRWGEQRYRRRVVWPGSLALGVFGLLWLIQRALGL